MPRAIKSLSVFVALSVALFMFDVVRVTPVRAATTVTTNETVPFSMTVTDCDGNPVLLSGEMHVVSHYTTGLPNGGSHLKMHTNYENVSGTGQVIPITYRGVSSNNYTSNDNNPTTEFTNIETFRLVSQGPTDNLNVMMHMHMTVNANGQITSTVVEVSVECNG